MTTAQEPATILKCRYRYATGCDATYGSKPGLYAHEKQGAAHAMHRVELRDCPECGAALTGEAQRGQHLSDEHGIQARSERRQELDARQVKALFDARAGAASPTPGVLMPFPPPVPQASAATTANGHSPAATGPAPAALDLAGVQRAVGELVAEVEALRAENAALRAEAATFARVRAMLAGDAGRP